MVCNWSPEPPREAEDRMTAPNQIIDVESDNSEDEMFVDAPAGYELLLPQGPVAEAWTDEEDESDTEANNSAVNNVDSSNDVPSTSGDSTEGRRRSEVQEVDQLFSGSELRRELTVDCDEVRAAMSGFTLPPSAVPQWAADVPESQWAATLAQRIQNMQGDSAGT